MEMNQEYSKIFNNWEVKRLIGSGSYGKVYEMERVEGDIIYRSAMKVITIPQNDSEIKNRLAEGESAESISGYYRSVASGLLNENRIMAELKGNSNIVSYEDHQVVYHEDGIGCDIFIRMELLTSFIDYMSTHEMDEQTIIRLGVDICKALEICDRKNIIHRDIKPGNIFVSNAGDFKLGDFGIARTIEKTIGGLSKKGTYRYMAPEVYKGEAYGKTVDICSLGLVMYYLANGKRTPFLPDASVQVTYHDEEKALLRRIRGDRMMPPRFASNGLARIILKACACNQQERYANATQMRQELEALNTGIFATPTATVDSYSDRTMAGWDSQSDYSRQVRRQQDHRAYREKPDKQKKGNKTAVIISIVIGIIAVIVAVACLILHSKAEAKTIHVTELMSTPTFEGVDGYGRINDELCVDEKAEAVFLAGISENANRLAMEALIDTIEYYAKPSKNLSNGDDVIIYATYDGNMANTYDLNVEDTSATVQVSGLKDLQGEQSDAEEWGGHYYKIVNEGMCWSEAKKVCEDMGGHLVKIESQEEENFIEKLIESNRDENIYHYWLGATDEEEEGVWKWLDGDVFWNGGPVDQGGFSVGGMYENWLPSQPNNSVKETENGQDYLEIQVTRGNEGLSEYMTWTDITNNGVAYGYEGPDDYNDTQYFGCICEWDK